MLEMLLCSLVTLLPDYLYRRYVQGKRFGKEITLYSVWFELRWGITGCLILTVLLITTVFYNHPSTTNVTLFYRTVPILPETIGRVAEINIAYNDTVKKGAPLFRLDSSKQEAAVESARRKIAEIDAQMIVARSDVVKADGQLQEARSAHKQTTDELETKQELYRLMRELADQGAAILFYSTDYDELIGCCDRVLVMYDGAIARELVGAEITERALVGTALKIGVQPPPLRTDANPVT